MQIAGLCGECNPHSRAIPREHDPNRRDSSNDNADKQKCSTFSLRLSLRLCVNNSEECERVPHTETDAEDGGQRL